MKKVIGIISIVLFFIITFQSCIVGVGNSLMDSSEVSGSAGLLLAFTMLLGGIFALVSKNSKGILITSIVFYIVGGIIGIANVGTYTDLKIWSVLVFIFAGLLIYHFIKNKEIYNNKNKIEN